MSRAPERPARPDAAHAPENSRPRLDRAASRTMTMRNDERVHHPAGSLPQHRPQASQNLMLTTNSCPSHPIHPHHQASINRVPLTQNQPHTLPNRQPRSHHTQVRKEKTRIHAHADEPRSERANERHKLNPHLTFSRIITDELHAIGWINGESPYRRSPESRYGRPRTD
jgi:hypothetical protein